MSRQAGKHRKTSSPLSELAARMEPVRDEQAPAVDKSPARDGQGASSATDSSVKTPDQGKPS